MSPSQFKLKLLPLFMGLVLGSISFAISSNVGFADGYEGHAGAGIVRNGEYLTFQSAGVSLKPLKLDPRPLEEVQGLKEAIDGVNSLDVPENYREFFNKYLTPSRSRIYYSVPALPAEHERFYLDRYRTELGGDYRVEGEEKLALYALTAGNETYLFPAFFKLKTDTMRAAILWHESLWAWNSALSYRFVIRLEKAFQRYIEGGTKGYDPDLIHLISILYSRNIEVWAAANDDYKNGRFDRFLDRKGNLPYKFLFGVNPTQSPYTIEGEYIRSAAKKYPELRVFQALKGARSENPMLFKGILSDYQFDSTDLETGFRPWEQESFTLNRNSGEGGRNCIRNSSHDRARNQEDAYYSHLQIMLCLDNFIQDDEDSAEADRNIRRIWGEFNTGVYSAASARGYYSLFAIPDFEGICDRYQVSKNLGNLKPDYTITIEALNHPSSAYACPKAGERHSMALVQTGRPSLGNQIVYFQSYYNFDARLRTITAPESGVIRVHNLRTNLEKAPDHQKLDGKTIDLKLIRITNEGLLPTVNP